jgi:hypothetical protein
MEYVTAIGLVARAKTPFSLSEYCFQIIVILLAIY